jgi:hypothetical protein
MLTLVIALFSVSFKGGFSSGVCALLLSLDSLLSTGLDYPPSFSTHRFPVAEFQTFGSF